MPLEPPGLTLRTFSPDEVVTFMRFVESAFLDDYHDEDADIDQALFEPERTLGYFDGAAPVATAIINTRRMTVPGGPLPVAAVTGVAVAPTHRRQGLLSALMRRQLTDLHDQQREAVAILWASEAAIYGRYGYGAACLVNHLDIASAETRVRPTVERSGRLQVCSLDDAQPALTAVYEQVRPSRAGYLDRPGAWWTARTYDPPRRRDGASAVRFAIHHDDAGSPDGYAIYSVKGTWSPAGPQGELSIRELQATTPAAYAAVWSFLLETDLVRRVRWDRAAVDEPLRYLVDNPRAVQQRFVDSLWVRLVDVDRALAGRTYATPLDVVLDVSDEVCPWNAGRYRLSADPSAGSAECRRTTDEPDLSLPVAALGAAYLGGTGLATLAAAGLVTERRPGALAAATTAFLAQRPPSCPEVF